MIRLKTQRQKQTGQLVRVEKRISDVLSENVHKYCCLPKHHEQLGGNEWQPHIYCDLKTCEPRRSITNVIPENSLEKYLMYIRSTASPGFCSRLRGICSLRCCFVSLFRKPLGETVPPTSSLRANASARHVHERRESARLNAETWAFISRRE